MQIMLTLLVLFLPHWLPAQQQPPRVQVLVLTGQTDLPYHDWQVTEPFLARLLMDTDRFRVTIMEGVGELTAKKLAFWDVLVLHYNGPRWDVATERSIEESVRAGKGLVAIHGVSYGEFFGMVQKDGRWVATDDPGWTAYAEMLGATWKPENIGHARRHVFRVKWTDPGHPIAAGLEPSFEADDELYHKMDLKPTANVLATAYSDPAVGGTGREEPQIWTVAFGRGRVVHITLGHDVKAMQKPGFIAAFRRSTEWAATGSVEIQTR